jgi:hypothetical protein
MAKCFYSLGHHRLIEQPVFVPLAKTTKRRYSHESWSGREVWIWQRPLASPAAEPCAKQAARRVARRKMATMSKVQLLAGQILKAETLAEAQAFARAISDADSDDEPSSKRHKPSKSPSERHWECYTSLVTDVCKRLAKDEEEGEFKPIAFEIAGDRWFSFARKHADDCYPDPSRPLSAVRETMLFSDSAAVHLPNGVAVAAPPAKRPSPSVGDVSGYGSVPQDSPDPFVNMFDNYDLKISLLFDAEEFATIMQSVENRGHITREVWAVCSAWAWALLGCRHDYQGMKARIEARKLAARAPSQSIVQAPSQSIVPYGYGAQGWSFASGTHSGYG